MSKSKSFTEIRNRKYKIADPIPKTYLIHIEKYKTDTKIKNLFPRKRKKENPKKKM